MTHILQTAWHDEAVEEAYIDEIRGLIQTGELDLAAEKLLVDIEGIGSTLAHPAKRLSKKLELDGWDEMVEAIAVYEGEPITAVHMMLSNDVDLSFEDKDEVFEPELEVALYSDEYYAFSEGDRDSILAESLLPDRPWFGRGEDMEVFLETFEFGSFNTSLLHHKRQHHFRDQQHELDKLKGLDPNLAPIPYIEFQLCSMMRAVAFHQLIKAKMQSDGLPNNIPAIVGMHNMKFDATAVYIPAKSQVIETKPMADLIIPIKRNVIVEEQQPEATTIRQTVRESDAEQPEKRGFFSRLFGRLKDAA